MRKNTWWIALIALGALFWFVWSTSAVSFSFSAFSAQDPIGEKFADVHFFAPGNDYAGSFFWLPTQQILPSLQISLGADSRTCTKKVRWLYFGNARGTRLWPLDQQTLSGLIAIDSSYSGLSLAGWLYTSCTNASNTWALELYSVYGQINYTWKTKDFSISMGRRYDVPNNLVMTWAPLVSSVQYFNNQTPIGYIYDNIAGIGFIGGDLDLNAHTGIIASLNSGAYINNIFAFATGSTTTIVARTNGTSYTVGSAVTAWLGTLWRIAVLGNVLLSRGWLGVDDRRSVLGNPKQTSIVLSDKMNISNSINQLKRVASQLCRGKTVYDDTNWANAGEGVVCIGSPSDSFSDIDPVTINLADTNNYDGKTLVVYSKNVVVVENMPSDTALNIFIDKGNLLISPPSPAGSAFDKDGNYGGAITWLLLRGNIFINGLLYGDGGNVVPNKLYIHGKFASLNTALEPTQSRKDQIESLFNNATTTYGSELATGSFCGGNNCINFNNVFTRECQLNGMGSDGNVCNLTGDRFKDNPLIVIDTFIPTDLLSN